MEGWISETWLLSKMKPMTKSKGELHGTGLIKRKFRHTDLSSLDDLARVVNESAACNLCQLVSTQDGTCTTIMPSQDWAGFLSSHFAAWMVSRSTITYALSVGPSRGSLPQEDRHSRGGDAVLAVGCVVTIAGGQTSPSTCNMGSLLSEGGTSSRGYENTAARRVKMLCALTLLY